METWHYDVPLIALISRAESNGGNFECIVEKLPVRYKVTITLEKEVKKLE